MKKENKIIQMAQSFLFVKRREKVEKETPSSTVPYWQFTFHFMNQISILMT
jgi:hypothetical protein